MTPARGSGVVQRRASTGEKAEVALAVGPYDAWQATDLASQALDEAKKTGLRGSRNRRT